MDIKIQNLKKIYNGNTVLDIDNLGVAKGELLVSSVGISHNLS